MRRVSEGVPDLRELVGDPRRVADTLTCEVCRETGRLISRTIWSPSLVARWASRDSSPSPRELSRAP